jgi:adenylyl-sulfate kinase
MDNIVYQENYLPPEEFEKRNGHKGCVVWLTGLSGSGKSTIARELQRQLFAMTCAVFVLDGDNVRTGINADLGFTDDDRKENIRRVGEIAKLFTQAGFITITAFISPFRADRDRVRAFFEDNRFLEIYVKADLEICEKRDPKGLYVRAKNGEITDFTGISSLYEPPVKADLVLNTTNTSVGESVKKLLKLLHHANIIDHV